MVFVVTLLCFTVKRMVRVGGIFEVTGLFEAELNQQNRIGKKRNKPKLVGFKSLFLNKIE